MLRLDNLPTGWNDLVIYVRDDAMLFAYSAGVVHSIEVKANETTDLGEITPDDLTTYYSRS